MGGEVDFIVAANRAPLSLSRLAVETQQTKMRAMPMSQFFLVIIAHTHSHNSPFSGAMFPVMAPRNWASRFTVARVGGVVSRGFCGAEMEPTRDVKIDWSTKLEGTSSNREDQKLEYTLAFGVIKRALIAGD